MTFTGWWLNWCMTQDAQQTQPELSPTDWVRRQTEEILKAGTTAAVDIINRPVVLFTTTGARSGKKRYVPLMRVTDGEKYAMVASKGGASDRKSVV